MEEYSDIILTSIIYNNVFVFIIYNNLTYKYICIYNL